jgi:small conductance mechanosensitive channel
VLGETLATFRADPEVQPLLEDEPKLLGIEEIHAGYYTVLLQARTNPGKRLEVGRALRLAILKRLAEERIPIQPSEART